MSSNKNSEMLEGVRSSKRPQPEDDSNLETLESDIKQMAQKLLEYRATLSDRLNNTLVSLLAAQRPSHSSNPRMERIGCFSVDSTEVILLHRMDSLGNILSSQNYCELQNVKLRIWILDKHSVECYECDNDECTCASEQNICRGESSSAPEDQEIAKKVKLLNEKISSNCSAMPIVLKNMKDCIAKFDKLDSYNAIIHPAFKRKRSG